MHASQQPASAISTCIFRQPVMISGAGKQAINIAGKNPTWVPGLKPSIRTRIRIIRAVVSNEDSKSITVTAESTSRTKIAIKDRNEGGVVSGMIDVKAIITIKKKMKEKVLEKIEDKWESFMIGIGQGVLIQLISEDIDPVTKSGKSVESSAGGWLSKASSHPQIMEFTSNLKVPCDFGRLGAILVTNLLGKEFYLDDIVVHGFNQGPIVFTAKTWIHSQQDNPDSRIVFRNQAYLPSQTPPGLKDLRREDLLSLRGNGKGERKPHERIYDYAPYNDLGDPDKSQDLARPVLGVPDRPYPRRCRSGRPRTNSDPESEIPIDKSHPIYVPRDETFEEIKDNAFSGGNLKGFIRNVIPGIAATLSTTEISFGSFSDIDNLYNNEIFLKDEKEKWFLSKFLNQVTNVGERLLKFDTPTIIKRDRFAWLRDDEFGRQALAGINPMNIELLKEFPILSKLDSSVYGAVESTITKEIIAQELDGMSVEEAIVEKRLFIIDYHDILLPFIERMNALPGLKAYATRTVLFNNRAGVLRPIVIELSLPPTPSSSNKRLVQPGHNATDHWLWNLAKAHVWSNESSIHQQINHWMRIHACTEPYIIATHRQLSSLHPVFKLLHPHMRYTLEVNALARQSLINGGGINEDCFSPGRYAMELTSAAYKDSWRFDLEALPADLVHRGMAVEDPTMPHGVKLVIEDFPYAADGLLIWSAIKELVESFVGYYYFGYDSITSDVELQTWWSEIINEGHYDKQNESWWPELNTKEDLTRVLTTMIWITSGQHAAINFGQFPIGGYVPNQPTLMRKLIPKEGESEYNELLVNPHLTFLSSLPTRFQATKVLALQDTFSTHSVDEEYLGQVQHLLNHWVHDGEVLRFFERFSAKLEDIETIINDRNKNARLKNRTGAGIPPYELLLPSSGPGVTGRGIPNSISI